MRVVLFSGPPQCGKDSLAKAVASIIDQGPFVGGVSIYHPAKVIRAVGFTLMGWVDNDRDYERLKSTPVPLFNWDTFREFMIRLLEDHLRPRYGVDFLSRITKSQFIELWRTDGILLLPSIGFQAESDFYLNDLGAENVLALQVRRNGCSFESVDDSRGYVGAEHNLAIENNQTLEWAAQAIVAKMVNLGWNVQ